jgi:hypothetical protein
MTKTIHILPTPGLNVPMPLGPDSRIADLPLEGMEVSASDIYWMRRLADGDVTLAPAAPAPSRKKGDA